MIDLTKPIRRRTDKKEIYDPKAWTYVRFDEGNGRYTQMLQDEFERDYENIPEPCRPREWWITLDAGDITGVVTKALTSALWPARDNAKVIHVIEWPADAPLPEWPK